MRKCPKCHDSYWEDECLCQPFVVFVNNIPDNIEEMDLDEAQKELGCCEIYAITAQLAGTEAVNKWDKEKRQLAEGQINHMEVVVISEAGDVFRFTAGGEIVPMYYLEE